jgi:hypothetical protein
VLLALAGCAAPPGSVPGAAESPGRAVVPTPKASSAPADRSTALGQLETLPVKGRAPRTGYERGRFGSAWLDTDRNGCDTRNDILRRDLTRQAVDPDTFGCVVLAGTLHGPYTGDRIRFVKGDGNLVDVDHVVALGNAWVTGAFAWELRKRAAFANDPMNLLAVDASANRQKGDGDAATWLPPAKTFRCSYVARQIGVKAKYGLWVTPAEGEAMARVLAACPDQPRFPDSGAPVVAPLNLRESSDPAVDGRPEPGATSKTHPGGSLTYRSCDEARAAGAAPLHLGDPGYTTRLDGDRDGVACE